MHMLNWAYDSVGVLVYGRSILKEHYTLFKFPFHFVQNVTNT